LHNHLRMDGSWHIITGGRGPSALPEHLIRALLGNDMWTAAGYRVRGAITSRTVSPGRSRVASSGTRGALEVDRRAFD
jgi:endonuclease-8